MSRGFVKESDQEDAPFVPPRAVLPEGAINYVTPRGLRLLHSEREMLEADRALHAGSDADEARRAWGVATQQLLQLEERLGSVRLVEVEDPAPEEVRFGATVQYREAGGFPKEAPAERSRTGQNKLLQVQIVGIDEAKLKEKRISYLSPLAQALIGKRAGGEALLELGQETRRFLIESVVYSEEST